MFSQLQQLQRQLHMVCGATTPNDKMPCINIAHNKFAVLLHTYGNVDEDCFDRWQAMGCQWIVQEIAVGSLSLCNPNPDEHVDERGPLTLHARSPAAALAPLFHKHEPPRL